MRHGSAKTTRRARTEEVGWGSADLGRRLIAAARSAAAEHARRLVVSRQVAGASAPPDLSLRALLGVRG